jgi:hypothetical protein
MAFLPGTDLLPHNRRRSKRLRARLPVRVRLQDQTKHSVAENTHTVIVNDHGALILLAAATHVQQVIHIENLITGKELLCRVALVGPSFMGKTQIAIEFIMPMPGFWNAPATAEPAKTTASSKTLEPAHAPKK